MVCIGSWHLASRGKDRRRYGKSNRCSFKNDIDCYELVQNKI
jgi:hypothetical protein